MDKTPKGFDPEISFVADWSDHRVFSDLQHVAKVDDPSQMLDQWRKPPVAPGAGGAEATVGRLETADAALISLLAKHSRAVCRIVVPQGEYQDYLGRPADFRTAPWSGTGFLVAPNILLTNHHVLNSVAVAAAATAEFDYQISQSDLLDGPPDSEPAAVRVRLNPDRLFLTSGMQDFDYSFVWIDPAAAEQFGTITMTRGSFSVSQTEPTYIIHHPGGQPKQASLDDTEVLSINSSAVLYAADTAGGSSGAPVFCRRGRLVALHHAWRPTHAMKTLFPALTGQLNDGGITNVVNEGIKMSAIAIDLEGKISGGGPDASAAATVLAEFKGSDTLTGLFGSLGRHREPEASPASGNETTAYEKVVKVYQGSEMDIDIGSWNIEWPNRDYGKPGKLERVATIITDLNLDIWALTEVSPNAVNALLELLRIKFNQEYKAAFSEPGASSGKQTTAVLWRPNVVEGERSEWPEEINDLFGLDSRVDLPFEAVHGKIFNRYPGLFRFKLKSATKAFDFFLVPLHLKAKGEGSLRRRLASKVLSHAVQHMIDRHGWHADWILLGDMNAPLASQDFEPLTKGGFTPLSAADERNGAFTYLKSPYKSLIDNIFVSANLSKIVDQDDFFIVATDRKVSRFVEDTSDHRPIAMRLSLASLADVEAQAALSRQAADRSLKDAFDALIANTGASSNARLCNEARSSDIAWTPKRWLAGHRSKLKFFKDNIASFEATIVHVNETLLAQYGAGANRLTLWDVAAIYMAEAGINSAGKADPHYVHSNGEFGLFPLPRNIEFWIGGSAPDFDAEMSLDDNIRYYLCYLGALKNKPVKTDNGRTLYKDLFLEPGIAGSAPHEAKLLAGVVHGYFWSGNYSDGTVPTEYLLYGYLHDRPLGTLFCETTYVHAGKPLMDNRDRNINDAFQILSSL